MITIQGRTALRRYFAGYESTIADTLTVGLGNVAGSAMQCEWARFPISNVGTDVDASLVIFKSSSPITMVGQINEIGLLQNGGGNMRDVVISRFTSTEESWIGTYSFTATNSRMDQGLKVTANATASTLLNPVSLFATADKDQLVLAGFAASAGTVKVTLEFANGAIARGDFTVPNGYGFVSINRTALVRTGTVDWQALTRVTIAPTVDYTADYLKFKIVNPWNETLIARTVLAAPWVTDITMPLDLEYALETN